MNRGRLLMIGGLALALGLLVSFTVYNRLRLSLGAGNEPGVDIVVAADDIPVGAKLEGRYVRIARFPQSVVPPGAFTNLEQVLERGVVLPIGKGEFILPSKLAAPKAGSGLPSLIPTGMRAVSVRVNDVVSVAGFVQPGSRVDVLATGTTSNGNDRQTTTVLENVAVIAVGKNLERSNTGESQVAPVITLLVSPDDAQKLTLASQEGRIQLALRNPLDNRKEGIDATRASSLYPGGTPQQAAQPKPKIRKLAVSAPVVAPTTYNVETIRGSKRDETKF
ncbi:MAG TPA: Flp pilus assembly protein CpaB [Terriglobales bacterium]|nr:Flp pilus assembly protein CpaB [Terriglobales bacterium]